MITPLLLGRINSKRYHIVPRMRDYDNLPTQWIPYLMCFQEGDYRSATVNTDALGFRWDPVKTKNILLGSSFVFGVGASGDEKTVARLLECNNFGGRAHTLMQHVLLYFFYGKYANKVTLLAGVNDLVCGIGIRKEGERSDHTNLSCKMPRFFDDSTKENLIQKSKNRLKLLKELTTSRKARLMYILQPFQEWFNKKNSLQETILFNILDNMPNSTWKVVRKSLTKENYLWFSEEMERICRELRIPFYDVNKDLDNKYHEEWLWVDRCHMTDKGYELVAKTIKENTGFF